MVRAPLRVCRYISVDGDKYDEHPALAEALAQLIASKNEVVDSHNAQVEAQLAALEKEADAYLAGLGK